MKHAKRTGKRALSVFMAVLMLVLTLSVAATAEGDATQTYKVTFINGYNKFTRDAETNEITYTPKTMQETDVAVGKKVNYLGADPTHANPESTGTYAFVGWAPEGSDTPINMPYEPTADTTLYALFRYGHAVRFKNQNAAVIPIIQTVQDPRYPDDPTKTINKEIYVQCVGDDESPIFPANPSMPEEAYYTHVFKEWYVRNGDVETTVSAGYTPNADATIFARYDYVGKTYHVVYYNYDGFKLGEENVVYGEAAQNVPNLPIRQDDDEFIYSFENVWSTTPNGLETGGEIVNLNAFDCVETDNTKIISLYPQYKRMLVSHYFTIQVVDEDGDPVQGAAVSVQGSDGQLLTVFSDPSNGQNGGVGYTDENGEVVLSVPYQAKYTISAVYSRYNTAAVVECDINYLKNNPHFAMMLHDSKEYNGGKKRCSDICHTRFGGIWITGLNLFYDLFKVKYVCCYDMYATHGKRLSYTVGSKGRTVKGY